MQRRTRPGSPGTRSARSSSACPVLSTRGRVGCATPRTCPAGTTRSLLERLADALGVPIHSRTTSTSPPWPSCAAVRPEDVDDFVLLLGRRGARRRDRDRRPAPRRRHRRRRRGRLPARCRVHAWCAGSRRGNAGGVPGARRQAASSAGPGPPTAWLGRTAAAVVAAAADATRGRRPGCSTELATPLRARDRRHGRGRRPARSWSSPAACSSPGDRACATWSRASSAALAMAQPGAGGQHHGRPPGARRRAQYTALTWLGTTSSTSG